jgi:hypothetical protein
MYEGGGIDRGLSGLLGVSSLSVNKIKGLSYLV